MHRFTRLKYTDVTLLSLDWCRPKDPPISLGSASILVNLLSRGCNANALPFNVNSPQFDTNEVVQQIFDQRPTESTLLGVGAFVWNEYHLQTILSRLQRYNFPGSVLLGGPQISYTSTHPQKYYPLADIFCRGYAEQAVYKLVTTSTIDEPFPDIVGIVYKGLPDLKLQATCDLETLPSPYLLGVLPPQTFMRWETQRGCPFRCSFCQHRESHLATKGLQKRRSFGINRLIEESKWMSQNAVTDVAILDPTFNSGPNYLKVMDALIDSNYGGKVSLQCRFEMIKNEFLERVVKLNDIGATVTLEFGLQTIIPNEAKAINRPNRIKKVEEVIKQLHYLKISFEVSLIFGLPLQTLESFKQSVNFCLENKVPVIKAWPLMLLRGTPLDSLEMREKYQLKERNICASEEIDRVQVNIPHVVESSTFNENEWKKMAEIANTLVETENKHPPKL